jgi:hypothetical protein
VFFLFYHGGLLGPPIVATLDLTIDHTNLECLVTDNKCNNLASFFTHHLYH